MHLTTDFVSRIAEECGMSVRKDYSGRGMYGKTCLGFVGSQQQFNEFLLELAEVGHGEEARTFAQSTSTDDMGFDTIFYFPGLKFTDVPVL